MNNTHTLLMLPVENLEKYLLHVTPSISCVWNNSSDSTKIHLPKLTCSQFPTPTPPQKKSYCFTRKSHLPTIDFPQSQLSLPSPVVVGSAFQGIRSTQHYQLLPSHTPQKMNIDTKKKPIYRPEPTFSQGPSFWVSMLVFRGCTVTCLEIQ